MEPSPDPSFAPSSETSLDQEKDQEKEHDPSLEQKDSSFESMYVPEYQVLLINDLEPFFREETNQIRKGQPVSLITLTLIMDTLKEPFDHRFFLRDPTFRDRFIKFGGDLDKYFRANGKLIEKEPHSEDEDSEHSQDPKKDLITDWKKVWNGPTLFYLGYLLIGSQGHHPGFLKDYWKNAVNLNLKFGDPSIMLVKAWIMLIDFHLYAHNNTDNPAWNLGHLTEICLLFNYVIYRMFRRGDITGYWIPHMKWPTRVILNNQTPLEQAVTFMVTFDRIGVTDHWELLLSNNYQFPLYSDDDSDEEDDPEEEENPFKEWRKGLDPNRERPSPKLVELKEQPVLEITPDELERAIRSAYDIEGIINKIRGVSGVNHRRIYQEDDPKDYLSRIIAGTLIVFTLVGLDEFVLIK